MSPISMLVPPLIVAELLAIEIVSGFNSDFHDILNVAAIAALVAGFFVVARYRAALEATDAASSAWRAERDAAIERSLRFESELAAAKAEIAVLRQRDEAAVLNALKMHDDRVQESVILLHHISDQLKGKEV